LYDDKSNDDGKSDYDGYDALYDGNGSNEPNWYDGSNDDGSNDDGSNESNWYDGSNESNWHDGNTKQIKN